MAGFSQMTKADRNRWLIVITMLIIAGYGLLLYPQTNKDYKHSENMINRRIDRLEKRTVVDDEILRSTGVLASRLDKRKSEADIQRKTLAELNSSFVKLEDANARQQHVLALTKLAEQSGLTVRSQSPESRGPSAADGPAAVNDRISGRPMVRVRARGNFFQLMRFLDGLKELEQVSAPLGMDFRVAQLNPAQVAALAARGERRAAGYLEIALSLSL
ncbi:MAG: hypothetical protein AAF458_09780 [Pseudomonadota bacterium]